MLNTWKEGWISIEMDAMAPTYLQPHYGYGFFGNVYLFDLEVNIAGAPLRNGSQKYTLEDSNTICYTVNIYR